MPPSAVLLAAAMATVGWFPGVRAAARAEHVDAATLATLVAVESTGRAWLEIHEHDGSCSVGLGGVNVPGCEPGRVAELKDPATNLRAAAKHLAAGRRYCATHPRDRICLRGGAVARYNPGDRHYAARVAAMRRVVVRVMAGHPEAPAARPSARKRHL
jgi:hypothetical protein